MSLATNEPVNGLTPPMTERSAGLQAIDSLVPLTLFTCLAVMFVIYFVRGNTGAIDLGIVSPVRLIRAKHFDHLMFYIDALLSGGIVVVLLKSSRKYRAPVVIASVAASLGITLGIFSVEMPTILVQDVFWGGFGLSDLIATCAIASVIWIILEWRQVNHWIKICVSTLVFALCVVDFTSFIRTANFVVLPGNDAYMLNEMLAQSAGKVPGSNFVPLYESMYGWILKPFSHSLSAATLTNFAAIIFTICSISAVALGVLIVYRVMNRRSLTIAALLVVPISCASLFHNPAYNISPAFQDMPIRVFPGMLVGALAIEEIVQLRSGTIRRLRLFLLGILCALAAWSNQDFALASVMVVGGILVFSSGRRSSGYAPLAYWLSGLCTFSLAYVLVLAASGTPLSLHYLFYFQSLFGKGYGEYPIQLPGPVILIMPLIFATASVGWFILWKHRRTSTVARRLNVIEERIAVTTAFFGSWTVITFVYYLNRSVAAGQLQIDLLPAAISIASLAALVLEHGDPFRPLSLLKDAFTKSKRGSIDGVRILSIVPITLFASLLLASTLQSPNPLNAFRDLANPPVGTAAQWPSTTDLKAEYQAFIKTLPSTDHIRSRVAYLGPFANYVTLETGIPNDTIGDVPPIGGPVTSSPDCQFLIAQKTKVLIVDPSTAQNVFGNTLCGAFIRSTSTAVGPWALYFRHSP